MVGELGQKLSHLISSAIYAPGSINSLYWGWSSRLLMGTPYDRYYINLYYMVDEHPYHRKKQWEFEPQAHILGTGDIFCQYLYLPRGAN